MKIEIEIAETQLRHAIRKFAQESLFTYRSFRYEAVGELKTLVEVAVRDAVADMQDAILAAARRHAQN